MTPFSIVLNECYQHFLNLFLFFWFSILGIMIFFLNLTSSKPLVLARNQMCLTNNQILQGYQADKDTMAS